LLVLQTKELRLQSIKTKINDLWQIKYFSKIEMELNEVGIRIRKRGNIVIRQTAVSGNFKTKFLNQLCQNGEKPFQIEPLK